MRVRPVLIVDDDNLSIFSTRHAIVKTGFGGEILSADSLEAAESAISRYYNREQQFPILILLEIKLCNRNINMVVDNLKRMFLGKISLVIMGHFSALEIEQLNKVQIDGYIMKPLSDLKVNYLKTLMLQKSN